MQKKNTYRTGTDQSKRGINESMDPSAGVFGKANIPGFDSYPETGSPNFPHTKTGETGIGTAKDTVNQLRRATTSPSGRAKTATGNTMKTSSNTYRRGVNESKRGLNVKKP